MYTCFKCQKLIKPVSLAANVNGESYHPQCISCFNCNTTLFGKPFKKAKDGKVYCEQPCQSSVTQSREQNVRFLEEPSRIQNRNENNEELLNKYKIQNNDNRTFDMPINPRADATLNQKNKTCKLCTQSVIGKTFITYENGDILCYSCENALKNKPTRIKSAHIIICSFCNSAVKGKRYFTEPNGKIICENCENESEKCMKCNRPLLIDDKGSKSFSNGNKIHVKCLSCTDCGKSIGDQEYFENNDKFLCLNCFELDKKLKCSGCKKPIDELYLMIENQPYHKECFKCSDCNNAFGPGADYFKDPSTKLPLCSACHLIKTGEKCFKCKKVIEKDGYTFADKHYHGYCFLCSFCNVELWKMKQPFVGKNENEICCEPCFSNNYCDKCEKCGQTISLHLPGIKFEEKMYHKECLACGRCKKSLVNKKFFKSGKILICEQCY